MDSVWDTDDGRTGREIGATGTGTVGGIVAPSGALVIDPDAFETFLVDTIESYLGETDGAADSESLASAILAAIRRTAA